MSDYNDNDDGASLLFNNYPLFVKDTIITFPCVTTHDTSIIDNVTNFSTFEVKGMIRLMYDRRGSTDSIGDRRGKKGNRKVAKHSRVTPYRGKKVDA